MPAKKPSKKTPKKATPAKKSAGNKTSKKTTSKKGGGFSRSSKSGGASRRSGRAVSAPQIDMSQKNLLIVESPAKAKTIKRYLGSGYEVVASMGHVVDLPDKGMGIDIAHGFEPTYEVDSSKKAVVNALKKAAAKMKVWLATDEDREGEAIARHLARELGLDIKKAPRIVFHEITKTALDAAIKAPRVLDLALVDAQQARRILDRLVGYELSPVLRRKIKTGLSAGRVQSVAVKLVVDREREITKFTPEQWYAIEGLFTAVKGATFRALYSEKVKTKEQTQKLLTQRAGKQFVVSGVEKSPGTRNPGAPFTTSTLQQEASRRLGYSVSKTMQLAQRLYESGHITYMRTDSISLSGQAMGAAGNFIKSQRGEKYHQPRNFKTKSASAQEAHEAIRPTHLDKERAGEDDQQKKLYHLIRQRALASQMSPAKVEKTEVRLSPVGGKDVFVAKGEVVLFDGFLKLYEDKKEDETETDDTQGLPPLKKGDTLEYTQIVGTQTWSKPAARFTEAMLVKSLEENGIGRPSTYAPTISTIQQRGYIERRDDAGVRTKICELTLKKTAVTEKTLEKFVGGYKGRLVPTDIGMVVTDFLIEHFPKIIDEEFTATVELQFDHIADGKLKRQKMIETFYKPFHATVENVQETAARASGERVLGKDPTTGKIVKARIGRFGPLVQIGESDDPDKKFASLKSGYHIEKITLEQALESFALPRSLGMRNDKEIKANTGRFGPYVQRGSTFASLPKGGDPFAVTFDEAVVLVEAKIQKDIENTIATIEYGKDQVVIKKGRRGYFFMYKRKKYNLPKGSDPKSMTVADIEKIVKK